MSVTNGIAAWFEIVECCSNELNNLGVTDIMNKILNLKLTNESKAIARFLQLRKCLNLLVKKSESPPDESLMVTFVTQSTTRPGTREIPYWMRENCWERRCRRWMTWSGYR